LAINRTKRQRRNDLRALAARLATVVFLGMMIVAAMYLYDRLTTSPRLDIAAVEFDGLARVDEVDLRPLLADLRGQNLLLAPLRSYEDRLQMHPRVARARLRRLPPNRVRCTITEREPVALLYTDRFLEVDAEGVVMAEDRYTPLLDLPIVTGVPARAVHPGQACGDPGLRLALEVLRICKESGGSFVGEVSELRVSAGGVTIRSLQNNCVLVLGDADYERRLQKYFLLESCIAERDERARLIDLRFEDQVVLRAKS
jgi:cell division septal protein FtsQ